MELVLLPREATLDMAEHDSSVSGYDISQAQAVHIYKQMVGLFLAQQELKNTAVKAEGVSCVTTM